MQQSFGNCPQYIQRRELFAEPSVADPIEQLSSLDDQARQLIQQADTCFVASYAHGDLAQGGVDISHRGGKPGFIHLAGETLWIPDFRGNRYMNTLGNLLAQPRAALLFIDFARGDILHLQGKLRFYGRRKTQPSQVPSATGGLISPVRGVFARHWAGAAETLSSLQQRYAREFG